MLIIWTTGQTEESIVGGRICCNLTVVTLRRSRQIKALLSSIYLYIENQCYLKKRIGQRLTNERFCE